ncbi:hypothetical protein JVU11DRAFT_1359 [Chiua virens]|nr:hypothetical protein JVU11DRAFT_1359 [Chiua virens]
MSRHRLVRNIDVHAELDDAAFDDEGEEMTAEEQAQMESGIEHIRALIGDEATSGLDDAIISDTLWQFYFDVDQSIAWLFVPHGPNAPMGYVPEDLERPRVPLIVLAQQGQYQPDYYPAPHHLGYDDPDDMPLGLMSPDRHSRLSTITERTERSEPSRHWPSRQQLVAMNNPRALSSSETMQVSSSASFIAVPLIASVEHSSDSHLIDAYPYQSSVDPNRIPPSPSPSAVQRLTSYDSAPSLRTATESEPQTSPPKTPRAPSISMPATDNIPEIPDLISKSSDKPPPPPPPKDLPRVQRPKRSKLVELASSRASTISSSRSSDLETTSVFTYPALRPSAESRLSLTSRATSVKPPSSDVSVQSLPAQVPRTPEKPTSTTSVKSSPSVKTPTTTPSSMSSHVRKAIRTAMDLEAHDQQATAGVQADNVSDVSDSTVKDDKRNLSPRSTIPF